MKTYAIVGILVALTVIGGIFGYKKIIGSDSKKVVPTATPAATAVQLTPDQAPAVSLTFSSDAHYVTVNIANLHAAQLEYNLIYDATVKGSPINTGVNAAAQIDGKSEYSKQQLLGSESSGKFTYHANIKNAVMELTLRDGSGRSVHTATYPFEVSSGKTISLTVSQ